MELKYARRLETLKLLGQIQDFEHEPKIFLFDQVQTGIRSYKPDFKVIDKEGKTYWVEVKGYMDAASKTKINRFKKYYPEETLVVVTKI
jgi:hypothetical protein